MKTTNHLRARRPLLLLLACGLFAVIGMGALRAQNSGAAPDSEVTTVASVADIEALLAALESNEELAASAKDTIGARYTLAIKNLKNAEGRAAKATAFRDSIQTAPDETIALTAQLQALPAPEDVANEVSIQGLADPQRLIISRRSQLEDRRAQLADAERQLVGVGERSKEIDARLPIARNERRNSETKLTAPEIANATSTQQVADRLVVLSKREALSAEIEMLRQEQLTIDLQENTALARRDLLERQLENDGASLKALEALASQRQLTEANTLAERIAAALTVADSERGDEAVAALAAEMQQLSQDNIAAVKQIMEINETFDDVTAKLTQLSSEFERIKEKLKLGGLEGTFGQVLAGQRRRLPSPHSFDYALEERRATLLEVRLELGRAERKLKKQPALQKSFAESSPAAVTQLVELRGEVLGKLRTEYRTLVRGLSRLDAEERSYRDKIVDVRDFLAEKEVLTRSSAPLSPRSFKDLPAGVQWLVGPERWRELGRASIGIFQRNPTLSVFIAIVVIALVAMRRRLIRTITESGIQTKRISTDRYAHTFKAVVATGLLTLPVPIVLGFVAWALVRDPNGSDWLRGFSRGLYWSAFIVAGSWFLVSACRRGGLGVAHFRWNEEGAIRVRRALWQSMAVYLPGLVIISSLLFENSSQHFDGVGRIALSLAHLWMAFVLGKLLSPSRGIVAGIIKKHPRRLVAILRYVWYPVVLIFPLALVVLACLGYVLTALILSLLGVSTLGLVAAGVVFYHLVLRWFMINERKLALEEAIEERRARREAAAQTEEDVVDESIDVEEPELDLDAVGQQTRSMLRSLTIVGVVIVIWTLWSAQRGLSVHQTLDQFGIVGDFSLLEFVQAVLVGVTFSVVIRNLPGLLELMGLRAAAKDAGTRFAIATLCQYGVAIVGVALLFSVLGLDWSSFGWIATGLSVGLGFGMQEIVANFISGIILLFERPVRVGDVVTLDGVTGTVTRIRMRATTVTNWDRQEYIVPNKQLVTGTFTNWTLTSPINRIVIIVGVAYGSDTGKALQILRDVAHDHPRIMDEPAPVVTFDQFADSTLNLMLRCYLPDMDGRWVTVSELNEAIDDRFKKAGIEIAFPQQDLHLKSINPAVAEGLKGQLAS
ncbi:MAG: potassium efflux system protein [Hyphomicrobiaceae bacterium]|jgi:potassium efflux system protein